MPTVTNVSIDEHVTGNRLLGLLESVSSGISGTLENDARLNIIHTRIVTTADLSIVEAGSGAAKAGGVLIMTIPSQVAMQPLWASVRGRLSMSAATATGTDGEVGLGSVIASGAADNLSGTATFENILQGGVPDLDNIAAGTSVFHASIDGLRTAHIGTGAAPTNIFLNGATNVAVAVSDLVFESGGVIEIVWAAIPLT